MLPKSSRLTRRDIQILFKSGQRKLFPAYTLIYSLQVSDSPQISVIVPTAIAKLASVRNSLRRKYYSQLELILPQLPPRQMIVLVKNPKANPHLSQQIGKLTI